MKKTQSFKNFNNSSRRVRRFVLAGLIAGTSLAAAATPASAVVTPPEQRGGISILVHEFTADEQEVITPAIGTHDSAAVETSVVELEAMAAEDTVETNATPAISRTSNQFNQVIAAAVSASAARAGISVEQILEPFAMFGPFDTVQDDSAPLATTPLETPPAAEEVAVIEESAVFEVADTAPTTRQLAEASALNRWWLDEDSTPAESERGAAILKAEVVETEVVEAITELAADEPVDVETEVAVAEVEVVAENVDSSVVDADELVGSAPLIATITDAYSPYDIAQRDLELEFLPLSTVQPIKSKVYVTLDDSADVIASPEQSVEIVASEPAIEVSPDCCLDELVHKAAELAEQTRIRDLTFAAIGESIGDLLVALAPAPQPLPTMLVNDEVIPAPVADDAPNAEVAEEIATVEVVAPEVMEVAVAEIVTMEVDGEVIPEPVADEIPNSDVAEEIAAVEVVTPDVTEVAVAEVLTMELDGEVIPAPVADEIPNTDVAEEVAVVEVVTPDVTEVAVAEVLTMELDGEVIPAPVADETPNADVAEEIAVVEVTVPETIEKTSVVSADDLSISKMLAAITKWQKQAIAEILAGSELASDAPTAEIAEKADENNENIVR